MLPSSWSSWNIFQLFSESLCPDLSSRPVHAPCPLLSRWQLPSSRSGRFSSQWEKFWLQRVTQTEQQVWSPASRPYLGPVLYNETFFWSCPFKKHLRRHGLLDLKWKVVKEKFYSCSEQFRGCSPQRQIFCMTHWLVTRSEELWLAAGASSRSMAVIIVDVLAKKLIANIHRNRTSLVAAFFWSIKCPTGGTWPWHAPTVGHHRLPSADIYHWCPQIWSRLATCPLKVYTEYSHDLDEYIIWQVSRKSVQFNI